MKILFENGKAVGTATEAISGYECLDAPEWFESLDGVMMIDGNVVKKVPQSITPLQAKLQLLDMELLDEVEAMAATDRKVSLYWNEALEIRRDHATLLAMASALGLSDTQVDEMFIEASKLS